ncbi:MAG: hypothetical protein ACOVO2_05125 [Emticicia sp.]|uniref:hypothetical protein n=1 Tax=Emticicia sp. TaxID=1930953 RepID=UPI003BA49785
MKKIGLVIILLVTLIDTSNAQKVLKSFENTATVDSVIYFENRTLRSQVVNFANLKKAAYKVAIPMIHGIPVAEYSLNQLGDIQIDEAERSPRDLRSTFLDYKLDFVLLPQFSASFGNPEKAVANQTNLLLNTNFVLPLGFSLYTGITFPLINNLNSQPLNIRPAPTFLSQFIGLRRFQYISWSAGLFYQDRYGVDFQYQRANPNANVSYGLDINYSGVYYIYPGRNFRYTGFTDFSALANASWRWQKYNTIFRLTAGRFLYKDTGAKIDLVRQFKKADIGFFGIMTTNGNTIGLHLAFAIAPGTIAQNKHLRLRTTEEFAWDYFYDSGFSIGERFRTNFQLDERLSLYHKDYWEQFQNHKK